MSLSHSSKTITDGLIFYYDMNNVKKSWKGAPTTNLIPSPEHNGRFTTSNGWGTYSTILYNSENYFSIGTISSVTSNIVTTATNHPFTTYDVIRPQTTGGGVTAGTDYFVKVISSTQFTLHAYNGSQNGSQGYINPATGTHKVYDSVALDQRISINSTSFPTMWWGAAHLPNRGHVKEIVPNGGYEYGTNCMRIHVTRTTAVDGGMAYGIYTPVTLGDQIVVSFWTRASIAGVNINYQTHFGSGFSAFSSSWTTTTEWKKVVFKWTSSNTYNFYQYFMQPAASAPYWIDLADLQVEVNKTVESPFVAGTRSNTQSVLDLTGNNTLTVNALTVEADGSFSFNGTTDFIDTGNKYQFLKTGQFSVIVWLKVNNHSDRPEAAAGIVGKAHYYDNTWDIWLYNNHKIYFECSGNPTRNGQIYVSTPNSLNLQTWYQYVVTYNNGSIISYLNGTSVASGNYTGVGDFTNTNNVYIGKRFNDDTRMLRGSIAITQIYNRTLSPEEVKYNFNSLRGRFGI